MTPHGVRIQRIRPAGAAAGSVPQPHVVPDFVGHRRRQRLGEARPGGNAVRDAEEPEPDWRLHGEPVAGTRALHAPHHLGLVSDREPVGGGREHGVVQVDVPLADRHEVRVGASIGWFSGSAAMPFVMSRMASSGFGLVEERDQGQREGGQVDDVDGHSARRGDAPLDPEAGVSACRSDRPRSRLPVRRG